MNIYKGDIKIPAEWTDLSGLPELYPGYTPGCHLEGNFYCHYQAKITSLEGGPSSVSEDFYCSHCYSLTSLKGAPKSVGGDFYCSECPKLTSLEGAPEKVGRDFCCPKCPSLVSLEGAPNIINNYFNCSECTSLTSLKGAPKQVGGNFNCGGCTSLTSLEGAPNINKGILFRKCTSLRKAILSVFKIKNLKKIMIDNEEVEEIVNKYLPDKDILECQEELIENGFKEYAKL